jgi:glycosyltransferase involved in cell wall biosynthesis
VPKDYKFFKKRKETVNGINVKRLPVIPRKKSKAGLFFNYLSFMIVSCIYAFFCNKNYDVIYVYQLSPVTMALPALIISKRAKKNTFLYCLDLWPESLTAKNIKYNSLFYNIMLKVSGYIYKNVTKIAVTSESFIEYFKNTFAINPNEIKYLPQYAEDLFSCVTAHEINKKTVNLVFAGNVGEIQSVDTIIYAANLTKDIKNLRWHIVGDGSLLEKSKKLSASLGLQQNVFFYGHRNLEEMPYFYSMADAMLLTLSKNKLGSYTIPGKLQSYMSAGKPIIAAIDGEARKTIEVSDCGLCCDSCDYVQLANNVRKFIAQPEHHKIYSQNALRYYKQNFDKSTFIFKTLEILQSLCEDK